MLTSTPHEQRSQAVIVFLREHTLISVNKLCEMANYANRATVAHMINKTRDYKTIPLIPLQKMEIILKSYGFNPLHPIAEQSGHSQF